MELASKLRELLGNEIVADDPETVAAHSGDKWFAAHEPDAVVFARSPGDVSKLLEFASREKIPVTARGGGFGYVGGCVPARAGVALSLVQMNRIKEISFSDAVASVEPGVFTADLKSAVRAQKLFYPPDPASMKDCTIGGNVATNAGGPRCLKYGVTRNYVIGLEVVLANGEVLRTGGRVHKNKTGFDLIGLFVGSEGMLGVITEITLRLLPLPPARATLSAAFATASKAAEAVQAIFAAGFLPCSLEIADHFTLEAARRDLGRMLVPEGNAHLLVDLDGQEESVRVESAAIRKLLEKRKPNSLETAIGEADCEKLWALRRQFSNSLRATGLTKLNGHCTLNMNFRSLASGTPETATYTLTSWPTATIATPLCVKKSSMRSTISSHRCWPGAASLQANTGSVWPRNAGGRRRPATWRASCIAGSNKRLIQTES